MTMEEKLLIQIAGYIGATISAMPKVQEAVQNAVRFIEGLVGSGSITVEQQKSLMDYVDGVTMAFLKGDIPPSFLVRPDPVVPAPTPPPA